MSSTVMMNSELILAIDPGTVKCGIAIVASDGVPLVLEVCSTNLLSEMVGDLMTEHCLSAYVIGNGTTGAEVKALLETDHGLSFLEIDEKGTTLQGRKLWLQREGTTGYLRYLPSFLKVLFEPSALDAYAAWALALIYLESIAS